MRKMQKRAPVAGFALLCFAVIALYVINAVKTGQLLPFDTAVRTFVLDLRSDILNPIMISITYLGNSDTITLICIVLLFFKRTRMNYGVPLAVTASISATIQTIIKVWIQRPRPPVENFMIVQGGFSFPSGHSCSGLVFYGLFAYLLFHTDVDNSVYKWLGRGCILLFLTIGLSRIYVGVHYPTDVLGGWMLGTAILMTAITLIEKVKEE